MGTIAVAGASASTHGGTTADTRGVNRPLRYAAVLFAAGFLFHGYDHLRMGNTPLGVNIIGYTAIVMAIVAIAATFRGHARAPQAATISGWLTAVGFSAVHFPPDWGPFSMPYGADTEMLSWVAAVCGIIGAAVFGAAGAVAWRADVRRHRAPGV